MIKQAANDVDQVKRLSSPNFINTEYRPLHIISENQLRESIHKWLSPVDPSTNHNIACDTHHKKAASWFFQGSIFREWKSAGSLLWVHGKRAPSPASYPILSDDILNCSWLRQKYSLVSGKFYLLYVTKFSSVLRSSKILKPCVRPEKHQWPISILTFGTTTSKACTTWSLPFSPNFLHDRAFAATFYPNFILLTTMERNSLATAI